MSAPRESEIKLDLDEDEAAALAARLATQFGQSTVRTLVSVYFDTARHALLLHGLTLRVRTAGESRVQTVKAGNGLFERAEWEGPITGDGPDLEAAKDTPVPAILNQEGGGLQPVFETVVRREAWTVERGGSRIEIALDQGEVRGSGRAEPIHELELELKDGRVADVFALLREIDPEARLRLGVRTKSERGYGLARGKPKLAFKADPAPLEPGMTAAAAFAAIVGSCLRQMRLNEPLMAATRGAEPLHQFRVGLRRLRSALSLFKAVVADEELERLAARLKDMSGHLGEARDLDVYLAEAAGPEAERDADEPGAVAYRAAMQTRRDTAYAEVLAILAGAGHRRLMQDLLAWAEAGPWRTADDPLRRAARERPIGEVAADILDRRRRAVKKKGRHLDRLDPAARHRVRIAAKKLRYAADFTAGLVRGRKERSRYAAFIAAMEALQTALGELNDIRAGHDLALRFARGMDGGGDPPAALFAAGHISGQQDERTAGLLADATQGHQDFVKAKRFWRRWNGAR